VLISICYIINAIVYAFFSKIKPPALNLHSPVIDTKDGYKDFMTVHELMLDFFSIHCIPGFLCLLLKNSRYVEDLDQIQSFFSVNCWMSLIQTSFIFIVMFPNRVDDSKSVCFNNCMPKFVNFAFYVGFFVMPILAMIFNLRSMFWYDLHTIKPVMLLIFWIEVALIIWEAIAMYNCIIEVAEGNIKERDGYNILAELNEKILYHPDDQSGNR